MFVLDPSRSHDVPQSHFPDDVQGVLMVDRYSGYKAMEQVKEENLVLAFCWAHVRRDKLATARHQRCETNLKLRQRTLPLEAGETVP